MKKTQKRNVVLLILLVVLVIQSVGAAFAASGTEYVGGGKWKWYNTAGRYACSEYYHGRNTHSASAQVGNNPISKAISSSGNWAKASSSGFGTTRVWWNNKA